MGFPEVALEQNSENMSNMNIEQASVNDIPEINIGQVAENINVEPEKVVNPVEENITQNIVPKTEISPLNTTFNTQPTNSNNNIIANISPAKFDILLKILNSLLDSNDPIVIKNSVITKTLSSGAILTTNLKKIFKTDFNLHIINPKKNVKLFKSFNNNNSIYISNDDENSRYIIMNGEIRLFMPKQEDSIDEFKTSLPSLEGVTGLAQIKINKETKTIISDLARESEYIEYLFQENKLKAIHIPETAIYLFEDYINDKKASTLDETNADLILRSTSFLPITAESFELNIGKLSDETYCSYTICDTGYISIDVYEELEDTTGGSIF